MALLGTGWPRGAAPAARGRGPGQKSTPSPLAVNNTSSCHPCRPGSGLAAALPAARDGQRPKNGQRGNKPGRCRGPPGHLVTPTAPSAQSASFFSSEEKGKICQPLFALAFGIFQFPSIFSFIFREPFGGVDAAYPPAGSQCRGVTGVLVTVLTAARSMSRVARSRVARSRAGGAAGRRGCCGRRPPQGHPAPGYTAGYGHRAQGPAGAAAWPGQGEGRRRPEPALVLD